MFKFAETVEEGAIVRVIGAGAFGLRVVGSMVGSINQVECIGVVKKDSAGPDKLPLVSLPQHSNQRHRDLAPLLEKLGTPDLVFVVTNLDEEDGLLEEICSVLHEKKVRTILVIPESAYTQKTPANFFVRDEGGKLSRNGMLIISESSMEQPHSTTRSVMDATSLQDHFFQQAIRLITDLFTIRGPMGIDFCDVIGKIRGRIMRVGVGIASGDGRALKAAEIAISCLIKQGVAMQTINSAVGSISGSSNTWCLDDYNAVSKFVHDFFDYNGECALLLGAIPDNSLGDNILVSFVAGVPPAP
jgi:cell division protein FtsZ